MMQSLTFKRVIAMSLASICCLFASAETVTLNFDPNPWGLEDVAAEYRMDFNRGKIEDEVELKHEGVSLKNEKHHPLFWNRIIDHYFTIYVGNQIILKVPNGKVMKHIDFYLKEYNHLSTADGEALGLSATDDKVAVWEGQRNQMAFMSTFGHTYLKKIVITFEDETSTGIEQTPVLSDVVKQVYHLNGIQVGTTKTFDNLPAGIYIINGKKVIKK